MKQNRNVSYLNQNKTKLNYVIKFSLIECSLFITIIIIIIVVRVQEKCILSDFRNGGRNSSSAWFLLTTTSLLSVSIQL